MSPSKSSSGLASSFSDAFVPKDLGRMTFEVTTTVSGSAIDFALFCERVLVGLVDFVAADVFDFSSLTASSVLVRAV
jgi:hypothetical protein